MSPDRAFLDDIPFSARQALGYVHSMTDDEIVWSTLQDDLPVLIAAIEAYQS
jgi:hypothetical protein